MVLPADVRREEEAEDLASITASFENLSYGDLEGEAMFRAFYADPLLGHYAAQAATFAPGWANFAPPPASS